jgi:hypothetical protein
MDQGRIKVLKRRPAVFVPAGLVLCLRDCKEVRSFWTVHFVGTIREFFQKKVEASISPLIEGLTYSITC